MLDFSVAKVKHRLLSSNQQKTAPLLHHQTYECPNCKWLNGMAPPHTANALLRALCESRCISVPCLWLYVTTHPPPLDSHTRHTISAQLILHAITLARTHGARALRSCRTRTHNAHTHSTHQHKNTMYHPTISQPPTTPKHKHAKRT